LRKTKNKKFIKTKGFLVFISNDSDQSLVPRLLGFLDDLVVG